MDRWYAEDMTLHEIASELFGQTPFMARDLLSRVDPLALPIRVQYALRRSDRAGLQSIGSYMSRSSEFEQVDTINGRALWRVKP